MTARVSGLKASIGVRRLTGIALIALMVLRAAVPVGFMPAAGSATGAFQFVICSGGAGNAQADRGAGDPVDDSQLHNAPCAFVALGGPMVAPVLFTAVRLQAPQERVVWLPFATPADSPRLLSPLGARAPPDRLA